MAKASLGSTVGRRIARYGAIRLAIRLGISAPVVGTFVALAAAGSAIRDKGLFGGTVDTVLNALPIVGALKNGIEIFRGDFIPNRPDGVTPPAAPDAAPPEPTPVSDRPPARSMGSRVKSIRL